MKLFVVVFFVILAISPAEAGMVIGGDIVYHVREGDTLERIGAKFGVSWVEIARANGLDIGKYLKIGQKVKINTLRIVPKTIGRGIIINIPDRTLYYFRDSALKAVFPVGLGQAPRKGKKNWGTPLGVFTVTAKEKDPTWYVPESIQEEMETEGRPVLETVPPGPDNPLGRYALKTSIPGILIHETIWPGSVYQFRSHGCIRVAPEHMEGLFPEVEINTPGELIYIPAKAAVSEEGRVYLEIHRDAYGKIRDMKYEVKMVLDSLGVSSRVSWGKIERMLKQKSGMVEDVTQ